MASRVVCGLCSAYEIAAVASSTLHIPYWTYKWAREDAHKGRLDGDTAGGQIAYMCINGLFGTLIGIGASALWPATTPLTIINIRERLGKNDGFFFRHYKPQGWNRKLRNVFKNLSSEDNDDDW